jgi:hypothetical protein
MRHTRKSQRSHKNHKNIRGGNRYQSEPEPEPEVDEGFLGDDEEEQYIGQELALDEDDVRELIIRYRNALTNMENRSEIEYLGSIIQDLQYDEDLLTQLISHEGESVELINQALTQYDTTRRINRRLIDEINEIHSEMIGSTLDGGRRLKNKRLRKQRINKRSRKHSKRVKKITYRKSRK